MHLITGARLHLAEPHRARRLCYGLQGQISTMKHEEVMGYSCRYYGNNDYGWLMGYYASVDHQCDTIGDIYMIDIYIYMYIYCIYVEWDVHAEKN